MSNTRSLFWKTAATHGLVVGALLVLIALIVWMGDMEGSSLMRFLNWGVVIGSVYYATKYWRDTFLGGTISYSQALGYGLAMMFLASVVFGFYTIIYMNYLDPESVQRSLDMLEESYYEMGFSEERIEIAMEMATTMQTPLFQGFSAILGTTFLGFLVSLIVALFVKRAGDPFQTAMHDISDQQEQTPQN